MAFFTDFHMEVFFGGFRLSTDRRMLSSRAGAAWPWVCWNGTVVVTGAGSVVLARAGEAELSLGVSLGVLSLSFLPIMLTRPEMNCRAE